MAKTPAQRGEFGRWLQRVRLSRYDTQAKALADIERITGLRIAPSEFAQWESGSRVPREDNRKVQALYAFFGQPEHEEAPPGGDQTALVAALFAQTKMLNELAALLRPRADEEEPSRLDWIEARLRILESTVERHHGQPADEGHKARLVPDGTGE